MQAACLDVSRWWGYGVEHHVTLASVKSGHRPNWAKGGLWPLHPETRPIDAPDPFRGPIDKEIPRPFFLLTSRAAACVVAEDSSWPTNNQLWSLSGRASAVPAFRSRASLGTSAQSCLAAQFIRGTLRHCRHPSAHTHPSPSFSDIQCRLSDEAFMHWTDRQRLRVADAASRALDRPGRIGRKTRPPR